MTVVIPTIASWATLQHFPLMSQFGSGVVWIYRYSCEIDSDNDIDEIDETNNIDSFDFVHVDLLSGSDRVWTVWTGVYVRLWTWSFELLDGADGTSFSGIVVNNSLTHYFVDASNVYHITDDEAEELTSLNVTNFSMVGNSAAFAQDLDTVVYHGDIITWADIPTFTLLQYEFSKDTHTVYHGSWSVVSANPSTFVVVDPYFGKDNISAYYKTDDIIWSDPSTFEVLNRYYSKDQFAVYYQDTEITHADVATFAVDAVDPTKASDQYRTYTEWVSD